MENVIKYLEDKSIVDIILSDDKKTVKFTECCDYYFHRDLNRDDFGQLIGELVKLHNQMQEGE